MALTKVKSKMNRKVDLVGREFETSKSGRCFVIDYKDSNNVLVMFYNPIYIASCTYASLIKGFVENPIYPSVYGRGYIGVGKFSCKDVEVQRIWRNLMSRAYCDEYHKTHPTYKDVEVCKEWYNFQNFAEWCVRQKGFGYKGLNGRSFSLDKDILSKGSKYYSPDTCCFVPNEVNLCVVSKVGKTSNVRQQGTRWSARISKHGKEFYLGSFNSKEVAFQVYKEAKEDYVREVAEKWKERIDDKVYANLKDWKLARTLEEI